MSIIRRILRRLIPSRTALHDYETSILQATYDLLAPNARETFERQLKDIALVQRHVRDKEVNLYPKSEDAAEAGHLLASPLLEWPIAMILCRFPHYPESVRATLWVAGGRVFSLIFSDSPTAAGGICRIDNSYLLFDPTKDTLDEATYIAPGRLAKVCGIGSLAHRIDPSSVAPPLPRHIQERFLLPANGCVPRDYRELMQHTNGFRVGDWHVGGLPLREVAMDGANFFVLAESSEPFVLCAMDRNRERTTYLWNLEEDRGRPLGPSFLDALAGVLS